jgi:hypothetical protein
LFVLIPAGSSAAIAEPLSVSASVSYRPPVGGVIIDRFRAPPNPFAAGNRGLDYSTTPGSPVRAAADGEVIFAGEVAGTLHITIRHGDGLRTSYSFVASIGVRAGNRVRQGEVIATTGEVFHFGVRDLADTYLDPETLFGAAMHVRLVPSGDDGAVPVVPAAEATLLRAVVRERADALRAFLDQIRPIAGATSAEAASRLRRLAIGVAEARPGIHAARVALGIAQWYRTGHDCTAPDVAPPVPSSRRIVIEVGGIGSTSEQASIARLDVVRLGYEPGDVVRFSYAGGRVASSSAAGGHEATSSDLGLIPVTRYDARDSQEDLRLAADRLDLLIGQVAAAAPSVPIDVIGHSQGGVVARLALTRADQGGHLPAAVANLVTLGSPHQGADLAEAMMAGRSSTAGARAEATLRDALGLDLDPTLPAGAQLATTSALIDEINHAPVPPRVRFTSLGARGDVVVPANRTAVSGPNTWNTVVPATGIAAHDELPGSAAATREVALAVVGRPPTCRDADQVVADLVTSETISLAEATGAGDLRSLVAGPGPARWPELWATP